MKGGFHYRDMLLRNTPLTASSAHENAEKIVSSVVIIDADRTYS